MDELEPISEWRGHQSACFSQCGGGAKVPKENPTRANARHQAWT